jgi:FkbM family methyltransferase
MQKVIQLIQEGKIKSVLDIGANQGYFSIAIKNVFPDIDILMIEANPFCDNFLKRTSIPYEMICLSDTEKEVNFYFEDRNFIGTGASYYLEKTQHYSLKNFTQMNTKRLDDVVTKQFDLIKLDTQGSELDIMRGGLKTVDASKYILIETSLIEYNENSPLKDEVFKYMDSIGFKPLELIDTHYMENKIIQEDWIFAK